MSTAELAALAPTEKLKMLEFLWDSLRPEVESLPVPEEHRNLLDERRDKAPIFILLPSTWHGIVMRTPFCPRTVWLIDLFLKKYVFKLVINALEDGMIIRIQSKDIDYGSPTPD